jgi:hypothetical protein
MSGSFSDIPIVNEETYFAATDENNVEVGFEYAPIFVAGRESISIPFKPIVYVQSSLGGDVDVSVKGVDYTIYFDTVTSTTVSEVSVERDFSNSTQIPYNKETDVTFIHNLAEKMSDFTEFMSPYKVDDFGVPSDYVCFDENNKQRPSGYKVKLEPGETIVVNIESTDYNLNYSDYNYDSAICGVYGYKDTKDIVHPPYNRH